MRLILGMFAAVALAGSADAANWVHVVDGGTDIFYIDLASATRAGNVTTFWVKAVSKPAKTPPRVRSQISKWILDCQASTTKVVTITDYGANGNVLYDQSNPYVPTEEIVPDSVAEAFKTYTCPPQ